MDRWVKKDQRDVFKAMSCLTGFQNILKKLKIYQIIPLTSCEPERIFSQTNIIINSLRNTIGIDLLKDIDDIYDYFTYKNIFCMIKY